MQCFQDQSSIFGADPQGFKTGNSLVSRDMPLFV